MPNSSYFNVPPLAAVAPTTTGPAAAVWNYFKRPLAGHRGAFKLFNDDIKTPRSAPLTNMSHQGNKYTFFSPHSCSCLWCKFGAAHRRGLSTQKRLNIVPFILPQEGELVWLLNCLINLPKLFSDVVLSAALSTTGMEKEKKPKHVQCRRLSCFQHVVPPALVKGVYLDAVVCVLLQDLLGVFVCVEGVHEDQGHIGVVRLVQVL